MSSHRIDGRKLSRKRGPRLALYKNLIVSVLRYERVQTTEAKGKEIRGQVERMITLAKRGDLAARRTVVSELPERAARRRQAVRRHRPQVRRPHLRVTPGSCTSASARVMPRRSSRSSWSSEPSSIARQAIERASAACAIARGVNTTERTLPGSSSSGTPGRSRESSRPRWPASTEASGSWSTGRDARTPGSTPSGR